MYNNTDTAVLNSQNEMGKIVEILNADTIIFPKAVLRCRTVYEESKMMFSIIFAESLHRFAEEKNTAVTVSKEMKKALSEKSDDQIRLDCICPQSKVAVIRKEVLYLINHTDISKCIRETETGKEAV